MTIAGSGATRAAPAIQTMTPCQTTLCARIASMVVLFPDQHEQQGGPVRLRHVLCEKDVHV